MFIAVTLISYLFGAVSVVGDKFLLGSKRISSPAVYSFYIALFGLVVVFFLPFGFYFPSVLQIAISLISGALFTFALMALYYAVKKSEASRVMPIVGAIIPIVTYFLSYIFLKESLSLIQVVGIIFLLLGGLLISFDLPLKLNKKKFIDGFYYSISAGILMAITYFLFKFVYLEQSFINGFIWTRAGSFLAVMAFFMVPLWRKEILASFHNFKKPQRKEFQTGFLFLANKSIGGISSILLNFAISLGSVTLVNSLVSTQYVFVLILASLFTKKYPEILGEKLSFWDWMQKIIAIGIIGMGLFMVY